MKKFLSMLLVLTMAVSMLALVACEPNGPKTPGFVLSEGATFDAETPVTINFYSTMGKNLVEAITPFIEEFQKQYPNITINHTQPGNYDTVRDTIKTELTVGAQPHLAYCYPDHVAMYNRSGKVVTLDQFINHPEFGLTAEQVADIIPGFYEEGRQFGDGFMYTLTQNVCTHFKPKTF